MLCANCSNELMKVDEYIEPGLPDADENVIIIWSHIQDTNCDEPEPSPTFDELLHALVEMNSDVLKLTTPMQGMLVGIYYDFLVPKGLGRGLASVFETEMRESGINFIHNQLEACLAMHGLKGWGYEK